jgi:hypothetical protein
VSRTRIALLAAAATLALAAASTVAIAAVNGGFGTRDDTVLASAGCLPASPPGEVVDVRLVDMGGGMGGGTMMRGGQGGWRSWHSGMMRVVVSTTSVPHGTVTLRVANVGVMRHELVILPLPAGQQPGSRDVGSDGTVDENGSVGEASRSCGAGAGDGIAPRAAGWVSLTLPTGRYELVCNLPGHYAAGMFAELDVT